METGEGDDSLNPFSKQGETQSRAGKRKVVSDLVTAPRLIKTRLDFCLRPHRGSSHQCLLSQLVFNKQLFLNKRASFADVIIVV